MAAITLVGTAAMGLLLVVLVLALARGIDWRSNDIFAAQEGSVLAALWNWALHSPLVWVVLFLGASFTISGFAVAVFLGIEVPVPLTTTTVPFFELVLGGLGVLGFAFLIVGTYAAARDRDLSPAGATLASTVVVGSLLLVGIAAQLLMG